MKILIAADMEGITGVVKWDHVDPSCSDYNRFRRIMTAEVNAAACGAFDGGATEVIVADGHSSGTNILVEELDQRVELNSGADAPFAMVQGIGEAIDGVIFVGYHARAGTAEAVLDHTWSRSIIGVWLNGTQVGEVGLNAAVCGHFNVPLLMVTGDQAVCAEVTELVADVKTVAVKQATSRFSAQNLPVQAAQELIQQTAVQAVRSLKNAAAPAPYTVGIPVKCAIEFDASHKTEGPSRLPGAVRESGRRICFEASDMLAAFQVFRNAVALARSW